MYTRLIFNYHCQTSRCSRLGQAVVVYVFGSESFVLGWRLSDRWEKRAGNS